LTLRDEPLGYKNPPCSTRFQKRQSGNPKGRAPKEKAMTVDPTSASALDDR